MAAPPPEKTEAEKAEQQRRVLILNCSMLQSVMQHVITLQSEPLLVKQLCNGDSARSAQLLANTQGIAGILSLFINQLGGKLSDALGRKYGMFVGPISNILIGLTVFKSHSSLSTVLVCRVLRMILTTFSSTVMVTAGLMDTVAGVDLGVAFSKMGALVGMGIIAGPIIEREVVKKGGHVRYAYFTMSILGALHTLYTSLLTPETLSKAKRKTFDSVMSLQTINPAGFTRIFTQGSTRLQKLVGITTLQMMLEGKNLSDFAQVWLNSHVKFSMDGIRNFVVCYGILTTMAGQTLTPAMLKKFSPREFTTVTNLINCLAYFLRGLSENAYWYLGVTPLLLPGVNGSAASALKSIISEQGSKDGFGMGELSGYTNNLRALAGAVAPVVYGNTYAWLSKTTGFVGGTWWVAGLCGAIAPQMILATTKDLH